MTIGVWCMVRGACVFYMTMVLHMCLCFFRLVDLKLTLSNGCTMSSDIKTEVSIGSAWVSIGSA